MTDLESIMNTFKGQLFNIAIRRPFLTILIAIIAVMAAAYGGSKLTFKSDYQVFFR